MSKRLPSKHLWAYQLVGICVAVFGIWQGWTMRKYADLDFASTIFGVVACWIIISAGKEKQRADAEVGNHAK